MKKGLMVLAFAALLVVPAVGLAADLPAVGSTELGETGLAEGDLPSYIGNIIRWVLGIIGVILVAMFVYGGVTYATSAGNEERVETGKRVMIYSIIGVVIVFAAFLISDYVISAVMGG